MEHNIQFAAGSSFTLDTLAEIFTRSFEGGTYTATVTAAMLSERIRVENLDLLRSVVLEVGGEPAGIALIGLRGEQAWCGGFGVMAAFRGQGLSHQLAEAMLLQARQAGARKFRLEVLANNDRALKTYLRAGLRPHRDLYVLEWKGEHSAASPTAHCQATIVQSAPGPLLAHFARLHPASAAWQRDLPALLVRGGLQALASVEDQLLVAYALFSIQSDSLIRIADLGGEHAEQVRELLVALQQRAWRIVSVNEPADSALTSAFHATGFVEIDRQHELVIDLA